MKRKEFSTKVKVEAIKRATKDGEIYCEKCGVLCKGRFEIDHVIPTMMGGDAEITNAEILCRECHAEKTKTDVSQIAKAKRREASHVGAKRAKTTIRSKGFAPVERNRAINKKDLPSLPRRDLYQ